MLRCQTQLITTMAGVIGLDHAAVFRMAAALGAPEHLVAEMLPGVEAAILMAIERKAPGEDLDSGEDDG